MAFQSTCRPIFALDDRRANGRFKNPSSTIKSLLKIKYLIVSTYCVAFPFMLPSFSMAMAPLMVNLFFKTNLLTSNSF